MTVEPLYDWVKVKGDNFPVEFTITSATNCQCFVPDQNQIDQVSAPGGHRTGVRRGRSVDHPADVCRVGKLVLGEV